MKKSFILLPLAVAMLSGCLPGGGGKKKSSSSGQVSQSGPVISQDSSADKSVTPVSGEFGTQDSPITVSQFIALCDKYCTMPSDDKGYDTYGEQVAYVSGVCTSNNTPTKYHEMGFVNLKEGSAEMLIMYGVFSTEALEEQYKEKDSMKGKTVLASGYCCLYNKAGKKTYELAKKDNQNKPQLISIS